MHVSTGGVIDLTTETNDGDELQKAIAASLQDTQGILGGQVSREEQDISRYVMFIIYLKLIIYCHGYSSN